MCLAVCSFSLFDSGGFCVCDCVCVFVFQHLTVASVFTWACRDVPKSEIAVLLPYPSCAWLGVSSSCSKSAEFIADSDSSTQRYSEVLRGTQNILERCELLSLQQQYSRRNEAGVALVVRCGY